MMRDRSEGAFVLERGTIIANKYVLVRPAGFGGMAELWVATNNATAAEVCVKLLVSGPADDPEARANDAEAVERFRREAYAAARLSHRAIIRVFDLIELDRQGAVAPAAAKGGPAPYAYAIVMELLRGETLGDLLAKRGKLPLEEALDLYLPVVSALAHAHRASVIHRDLKPDNIFLALDPDGQVIPKVLDFGVSKLSNAEAITIDGVLVGTPSFMSPEQARGTRQVDCRSDVFSAGLLLYLMLSGTNPFDEGSFASVVEAVLRREVPPIPDLPDPIWSVIHQALEKDPAARFGDATEMGIALRKAAGRTSSTESTPSLPLAALSSRPSLASLPGSGTRPSLATANDTAVTGAPEVVVRATATRRLRTIVAAVLGMAVLVLIAGLIASAKGKPDVTAMTTPASQPTTSAVPVAVTPLPTPAPRPDPPAPSPAVTESAAPVVQAVPVASHPAAQPAALPPPRSTAPSQAPPGKPKRPSIMARDPGF